MKKIAISTLVGEFNNGNRLQNYAMQQLLENNFEGIEVFTIRNNPYYIRKKEYTKRYLFFKKCYNILNFKNWKGKILEKKRKKVFQTFNENIKFDDGQYYKTNLRELNGKYDYFICGSDQVWNGEMSPNLATHLLEGIDNNKKISYSASLGKNFLHDYEKALYKKFLPSFKAISVRENESIDLIKTYNPRVETHLDPTFMLSANEWEQVMKRPSGLTEKKYIFVCLLGELSKEFKEYLLKISQKFKLKIINIMDQKSRLYTKIGPSEFLYLIKNSEIVFADSFHALVFSIIFKKPAVHVQRKDAFFSNMSSRINNLECVFQCKFKNFDKNNLIYDNSIFEFYINDSDKIIQNEKKKSLKYLRDALSDVKQKNNLQDLVVDCSGCGLCSQICPTKAISYFKNDSGFIVPKIDEKKCIHCGKCKNNCSELVERNNLEFKNGIYALKRKNGVDEKSSSTGLFGAVAEKVIDEGGVVFGAKYSKTQAKFACARTKAELESLKGSKYYQFDITDIYDEVEDYLNQGKKVLISGTPCQIAGIRKKFESFENLILIQVICHGVPAFDTFKKVVREKYGKIPENVNFKKKIPSWINYSVEYKFGDDVKTVLSSNESYMKLFLSHKALNECCYNCKYAGKETGADLIIGDCWGIRQIDKTFYDENGVSIVVPNSETGMSLLNESSNDFENILIPKEKYKFCNINLFKALSHDEYIKSHYEYLQRGGVETNERILANKTQKRTLKDKIISKIRRSLKI